MKNFSKKYILKLAFQEFANDRGLHMAKTGVYVHVPFCASKCPYCDFYSVSYSSYEAQRYVSALVNQLRSFPSREVDTVYFGGGTPSLLPPRELARLLEAISRHMILDSDAEITLELNPETAAPQTLAALRQAGINRVSVGLQSTDDNTLRRIGRRHTAAQGIRAIEQAAAAGFVNISADIMLALPGQTPVLLDQTLTAVGALPIQHVSAYLLKLADGTPFGQTPPSDLPDDDAQAALYKQCVAGLTALGFMQYEISNFAHPKYESRHNLKYWLCHDYLGLGPGAHSSLAGRRYRFAADLSAFLNSYAENTKSPRAEEALITEGAVTAQDAIMLRLRLAAGLDLDEIYNLYNYKLCKQSVLFVERCAKQGLLIFDEHVVRLTTRGMLVSNAIISGILWPSPA